MTTLTLLGTGGPHGSPDRASSGYLRTSDDGRALLVDAGGGVLRRLAEARAPIERIDAVAITHWHPDHTSDLAAVLWASALRGRRSAVRVVGPACDSAHPGTEAAVTALFGEHGPWCHLRGFAGFAVEARDLGDPRVELMPGVALRSDPYGTATCRLARIGSRWGLRRSSCRATSPRSTTRSSNWHGTPIWRCCMRRCRRAPRVRTRSTSSRTSWVGSPPMRRFGWWSCPISCPEAEAEADSVALAVSDAYRGPVRVGRDLDLIDVGSRAPG